MTFLKLHFALLLALMAVLAAEADVVELSNGTRIRGRIVRQTAESVKVESSGMTMTFPRHRVVSVEQSDAPGAGGVAMGDTVLGFFRPDLVARVGPGGVSRRLYDIYLRRKANELNKKFDALSEQERAATLERAINEELLFQAALASGIHENKTIRQRIIATYRSKHTTAHIDPRGFTEDEIRAYYNANRQTFVEPAAVKLKWLTYGPGIDQETVRNAWRSARANPDSVKGWHSSRGWATVGNMPTFSKSTQRRIVSIRKGQVSEILKDEFDVRHIFWVSDRRPAKQLSLAESRAKIIHKLIGSRQHQLDGQLNQRLRSTSIGSADKDELAFRSALQDAAHYDWHTRQRIINTYVHEKKRTREQLLSPLRSRFHVKKIEPAVAAGR